MKKIFSLIIFLLMIGQGYSQLSQSDSVTIPSNTDIFAVQIDSLSYFVWRKLTWWRLWNSSGITNNTFPPTLNLLSKNITMDGMSAFTMTGTFTMNTGTFRLGLSSSNTTYRNFGYTGADGYARPIFNYGTSLTDSTVMFRDFDKFNTSIIPLVSENKYLGDPTHRWLAGYFSKAFADTFVVAQVVHPSGPPNSIEFESPITFADSTLSIGKDGFGNQIRTLYADSVISPNQALFLSGSGGVKVRNMLLMVDSIPDYVDQFTLKINTGGGVVYVNKADPDTILRFINSEVNTNTKYSGVIYIINVNASDTLVIVTDGNIILPDDANIALKPMEAIQLIQYMDGATEYWIKPR